MLTRSDAEIAADEVMGWIEYLECLPKSPWFNEVTSMLNHLYELHKLRDEEFCHRVLVSWDVEDEEYCRFIEMQTY